MPTKPPLTEFVVAIRASIMCAADIRPDHEIARLAGCSRSTLAAWKHDPRFAAMVEAERAKLIAETRCAEIADAEDVLKALTAQMRGDLSDLFDDDGNIDWQKLRKSRLVKRVKHSRGEGGSTVEIERVCPQAAAVQLGRHHKLFTDKIDLRKIDDETLIELLNAEADTAGYGEVAD